MAEQPPPTLTIQLPPLTPSMKAAFVPFYEDTVNGVEPAVGTFDEAAFAFSDEKGADPGTVDEFFNAFTPLWTQQLAAGAWLDKAGLRAVNGDFENDFNATVTTILDGVYALPDGRKLAGLEKDLALTYGCRNRGAHHLSGGVVINSRFNEVRQSLMNTLFLAVELMPV